MTISWDDTSCIGKLGYFLLMVFLPPVAVYLHVGPTFHFWIVLGILFVAWAIVSTTAGLVHDRLAHETGVVAALLGVGSALKFAGTMRHFQCMLHVLAIIYTFVLICAKKKRDQVTTPGYQTPQMIYPTPPMAYPAQPQMSYPMQPYGSYQQRPQYH